MSEKNIDTFYTFEELLSFKLQPVDDEGFLQVKHLGSSENLSFLGIKRAKDLWDVVSFSADNNKFTNVLSHLKATPLQVNSQHNFVLSFKSSSLFCTSLADRTQTLIFPLQFYPKHCVSLPSLDATLILSQQPQNFMIFMNAQKQPLGQISQSLTRALSSLGRIDLITSDQNERFAIVDGQKIIVIGLEESKEQQGRKEFKVVDRMQIEGSKVIGVKLDQEKVIVITQEKIIVKEKQQVREILHRSNLFRPKQINFNQEIVIQDKTGETQVFNENQTINQLVITSDNQKHQLFIINENVFAISQNLRDKSQFQIEKLQKISVDSILTKLLENEEGTYTALQIMRSTGQGKDKYLKYQLNKKGFSDIKDVQEYLKASKETSEQLLTLLSNQKYLSPQVFQLVLDECLSRCTDAPLKQTLLLASARLHAYTALSLPSLPSLANFCLSFSTLDLLASLIPLTTPDTLPSTLASLHQHLSFELSLHYPSYLYDLLPLEHLPAQYILKNLLPNNRDSEFFKVVRLVKGEVDEDDVYQRVCEILRHECKQPGKAVVVAQEAAQKRGVKGLSQIAWKAVKDVFKQEYNGQEIKDVVQVVEEPVKVIQRWFEQSKWIFVTDHTIYIEYIKEISDCISSFSEFKRPDLSLHLLNNLLQHHTSSSLLFLHDPDLAHLALSFIYSCPALSTEHTPLISDIAIRLQELSLTPNQALVIRRYLTPQIEMQSDIVQHYQDVEVTYVKLFRCMTSDQVIEIKDMIEEIVKALVESQGRRSRKIGQQQAEEAWVQTLEDVVRVKSIIGASEEIDVYSMFIKSLLENRVTSSIEHLIKKQILPRDQLQTTVLKFLQDQYNHCDSEKFYSFAQNAKQFLEMLIKYDPEKKYEGRINQELKLIECSFFLKQNRLLIDSLPKSQIRSDFLQNRLVDRVLQVHGFKEYPDSFSQLAELQSILDSDQVYTVIAKVLKHLNAIKLFESADYMPAYTQQMIQHLFLNRSDSTWLCHDPLSGDILFKLALISPDGPFRSSLLHFLLTHLDKRSDTFLHLCRQLVSTLEPPPPPTFLTQLKTSLEHGLYSKAKQIMCQQYRCKEVTREQLCAVGAELSVREIKQVAKRVKERGVLERVKRMEEAGCRDSQEIIRMIGDDKAYGEWLEKQQKMVQKPVAIVQNVVAEKQSQIEKIMNGEEEDIEMMLDMDYSDWQGDLDLGKILHEVRASGLKRISPTLLKVVTQKLGAGHIVTEQVENLENINPLVLIQDLVSESEHESSIMTDQESEIVKEFRAVVTDTNVIRLSVALEKIKESYPSLLALCLYANKIEVCNKNEEYFEKSKLSSEEIGQIFYQFLDKDVLEEMIDNTKQIQTLNSRLRNSPYLSGVLI